MEGVVEEVVVEAEVEVDSRGEDHLEVDPHLQVVDLPVVLDLFHIVLSENLFTLTGALLQDGKHLGREVSLL